MLRKRLFSMLVIFVLTVTVMGPGAFVSAQSHETQSNEQKTIEDLQKQLNDLQKQLETQKDNEKKNNNSSNSSDLPPFELFKPDVEASIAATEGFVKAMNIIIGIVGILLIMYIVWRSLSVAKRLASGNVWREISDRMVSLGIALSIVLIGFTGIWYRIVVFLWTKVLDPVIANFS